MLLLASVALVMPALFELVAVCRTAIAGRPGCRLPRSLACMSAGAAVVLLARYCAGLIFSLGTHRDLYNPIEGEDYVVLLVRPGRFGEVSRCSLLQVSPSA